MRTKAKAFTWSISYYDINQAVVGLKGQPITKVKTVAGLKPFKPSVPIGTSYNYVVKYIKPGQKPAVFKDEFPAINALEEGQVDGLVISFHVALISLAVVENSVVVGRLPHQGKQEHFALVLQKGNPLVTCVNTTLAQMQADGTLKRFEHWLAKAGGAPYLKK